MHEKTGSMEDHDGLTAVIKGHLHPHLHPHTDQWSVGLCPWGCLRCLQQLVLSAPSLPNRYQWHNWSTGLPLHRASERAVGSLSRGSGLSVPKSAAFCAATMQLSCWFHAWVAWLIFSLLIEVRFVSRKLARGGRRRTPERVEPSIAFWSY